MEVSSEKHFNEVAGDYDNWKQKNWYYYQNLKNLFSSIIPKGSRVLEIGCGTGHVLGSLDISYGHGIDISEEMIEIAKKNYGDRSNLKFETQDILKSSDTLNYDIVIIPDTIGHIENLEKFIGHISSLLKPGTPVVISTANSLWRPVLEIAEKLKMKSPEGPHWWLSKRKNEEIFSKCGFKIVKNGSILLIPKKVIGADWINQNFNKNSLLSKLGLNIWWVLEK